MVLYLSQDIGPSAVDGSFESILVDWNVLVDKKVDVIGAGCGFPSHVYAGLEPRGADVSSTEVWE